MHSYQAYMVIFGDDVLPKIQDAWKEYQAGCNADETVSYLSFQNKEARRLLAGESEDVRKQCDEYRKRGKEVTAEEKQTYAVISSLFLRRSVDICGALQWNRQYDQDATGRAGQHRATNRLGWHYPRRWSESAQGQEYYGVVSNFRNSVTDQ